jgi:K+-sensing histidine kinase KdpD
MSSSSLTSTGNGELRSRETMATGVFRNFNFEAGFVPYWNTLWMFFGVAFLGGLLEPVTGYRAVGFVFLLGVLSVGTVASRGPVLFAAFLSAGTWDYFFIPPRFTLLIARPEDVLLCLTYFVAALITGYLASRARAREAVSHVREQRGQFLVEILDSVPDSRANSEILNLVTIRIASLLQGKCEFVPASDQGPCIVARKSSRPQVIETPIEQQGESFGVLVFERQSELDADDVVRAYLTTVCRLLALVLGRKAHTERKRPIEIPKQESVLGSRNDVR